MTTTSSPSELRVLLVKALLLGGLTFVLLHYAVTAWLTFDLVGRADLLSTKLFSVGPIDVRLWWLVSALIVVLCLAAHVYMVRDDMGEGYAFVVFTHLPAAFGAWVLVWKAGFSGPGGFFANVGWTVLFGAMLLGSACVIAKVVDEMR